MEEPSNIQKIVLSSIRKEPSAVGVAFNAAMTDKLTDLLTNLKIETARSLFLNPGETLPEVEDTEVTDEN